MTRRRRFRLQPVGRTLRVRRQPPCRLIRHRQAIPFGCAPNETSGQAAARATTLPIPHRGEPESWPSRFPAGPVARSWSRTCTPRATNRTPCVGVAPASSIPCPRASALAPACFTSSAISSVVACAPLPPRPMRCTTPLSGAATPVRWCRGGYNRARLSARLSGSINAPSRSGSSAPTATM